MSTQKKALLVDDNSSLLRLIEMLLESNGYETKSFESPIPAIFHAMHERCDLLISDVWMPQLKGQELVAKIRETPLNQDIPVLFISGHPASDLTALENLQNMQFMHKPFSSDALLSAIENLTTPNDLNSN